MRKLATLLFLGLFAVPMVTMAGEVTVEGLLVDTRCYGMSQDNIGQDHKGGELKGCATACAKMGIPVALLKDGQAGGDLYVLSSPAPMVADHMAKEARLVGDEIAPGLVIPKKLEVKSGDAWEEVQTSAMM